MLGFEQILMQVVTQQSSDVIDQIATTATAVAGLVTILGGIVTYAITKYRSVRKEQLTERDKWLLEGLKASQITAQKGAEQIGQSKEVIKAIYELNVPESQRKEIQEKLGPLLAETNERLKAANEQAVMIKAKTVQIFGEAGDVDKDTTVPREAKEISTKLRGV
jgi:hypothetical protein